MEGKQWKRSWSSNAQFTRFLLKQFHIKETRLPVEHTTIIGNISGREERQKRTINAGVCKREL